MTKKVLKMFTAATVAASVVAPVASAAAFNDVPATNSHAEAIEELVNRGVINGYEDGTYRPNATLTRAQAAKILANALQLNTTSTKQVFSDVPATSGYVGAINALAEAGIINGYEDGTFKPNAPLTRGQMAKILVNSFKLEKSQQLTHSFTDVSAANGYNLDIQTLVNYNITQGTTNSTYSPSAAVKRGQMASFVVRAENAVKTADSNETTIVVSSVAGTTVNSTYEVDASLQSILAEVNNSALKNAKLTVTVENNRITAISKLELTASGSKEKALIFDAKDATLNGALVVTGNYIMINNMHVTGNVYVGGSQTDLAFNTVKIDGAFNVVQEPAKVASLTAVNLNLEKASYQFINSTVSVMNIARNFATIVVDEKSTIEKSTITTDVSDVTLQGTFKEVIVATTDVKINGQTTILALIVNSATTKIVLDVLAKVASLVLPTGANAENMITNYNDVKQNIATVENNSTTVSAGGSSGGSSSKRPSNTGEIVENDENKEQEKTPQEVKLDAGDEQLDLEKPQLIIEGEEVSATIYAVIPKQNPSISTQDTAITTVDSAVATMDSIVTTIDTSTVEATKGVEVYLSNGQTYTLAADLEDMFNYNDDALKGAQVKVIVNNGRIEAITELKLDERYSELLDGGGKVVIYGNVYVANSLQKLMNITVTGNVVLQADRATDIELVKTTVFGKVQFEEAKVALLRAQFAGIGQVAAATTRIKVTFTDSTVAIIEVQKEDVDLYAGGTTEVASIRLFSNATLDATNLTDGKILPKIVIGQGVTNVTLNASIANVVIESDENIIVSGKGNFDEVTVNTTKEVALNTVGTIGNLNVKTEQPQISLGDEIEEVGTITTSLSVVEAITNFEEIKDKVQHVETPNTHFFAMDIISHETKFGYYYIKLAETKNYKVMYKLFEKEGVYQYIDKIERGVTVVPTDAFVYTPETAIAIPANKQLVVYLVKDNKIVDFEYEYHIRDTIRFTTSGLNVKIETTIDVVEGTKASDTYDGIIRYAFDEPVVFLGNAQLSNYTWKKEDNLGVITVPVSSTVFTTEGSTYFELAAIETDQWADGYSASYGGDKERAFKAIQDAFKRSETEDMDSRALMGMIHLVFHAEDINKDNFNNLFKLEAKDYREAVKKATSLENLYDLIVQANQTK